MTRVISLPPGNAYQSIQQPMTAGKENARIQGFRGPVLSAIAPSTGAMMAIARPPSPVAKPQIS